MMLPSASRTMGFSGRGRLVITPKFETVTSSSRKPEPGFSIFREAVEISSHFVNESRTTAATPAHSGSDKSLSIRYFTRSLGFQ